MVRIKNVKVADGKITCDIYPEDSKEKGTLEIDIESRETLNYTLPKGYEYCSSHRAMARKHLLKSIIDDKEPVREEYLVMWY